MTTTEQSVRNLLRATDDVAGWHRAVQELARAEAVPILVAILRNVNEEEENRRLAATMLGMLGDDRAIPALAAALLAPDRILRGRAAEMLGQFPQLEGDVFQQLVQGLQDRDAYFRECCATALSQLRKLEALPALEQMSKADDVPFNREVAKKAIAAIRGG